MNIEKIKFQYLWIYCERTANNWTRWVKIKLTKSGAASRKKTRRPLILTFFCYFILRVQWFIIVGLMDSAVSCFHGEWNSVFLIFTCPNYCIMYYSKGSSGYLTTTLSLPSYSSNIPPSFLANNTPISRAITEKNDKLRISDGFKIWNALKCAWAGIFTFGLKFSHDISVQN